MSVLLLRLSGPMQSWGTQSRFSARDSGLEPSRSGVIGLLCAAAGRPRSEPLDDFRSLRMAVRVNREGELRRDFQTAGGGRLASRPLNVGGRSYGVARASGARGDTVISQRDYLADADFLVALAGDSHLLAQLDAALAAPVWPMFLGRKSFVPGLPVRVAGGLHDGDEPEPVLRSVCWTAPDGWIERQQKAGNGPAKQPPAPQRLRLIVETENPQAADGHPHDVPLSFEPRRFTTRHTVTRWIESNDLQQVAVSDEKGAPCT